MILAVVVHPAHIQDRDGAKQVLTLLQGRFPRLQRIWADGNDAGELIPWVFTFGGWVLEIVRRPKGVKGFVLLPHRWIVERTFAWLGRSRRLSKDYEETTGSSEAFIKLAMIHLMARRLVKKSAF